MGSILSSSSEASSKSSASSIETSIGLTCPDVLEESQASSNDFEPMGARKKNIIRIPEKYNHLKTRDDTIQEFGKPLSEMPNSQLDIVSCVEEDMFLMEGGWTTHAWRLIFPGDKFKKIVYLDYDKKVIAIFD